MVAVELTDDPEAAEARDPPDPPLLREWALLPLGNVG